MDIIDYLYYTLFQRESLETLNMLFSPYEVYVATCVGIIISDGISVKINIQ